MKEIKITSEYANDDFDWNSIESLADTKITFDNSLSADDICSTLSLILYLEEKEFTDINSSLSISLRGLDTDKLVQAYRCILTRETLINPTIIINISLLINGYNTLDDSMFNSEDVFESSLDQMVDVKLELKQEIKALQNSLAYWYLGCIKYMSKVEYTYLDDVQKMPSLYHLLLLSSTFMSISSVIQKATDIDWNKLPIVEGAYFVVSQLSIKSSIDNKLLSAILNG